MAAGMSDLQGRATAPVNFADVDQLETFGVGEGLRSLKGVGVVLFWGAVLALLAARVLLFDPSAERPAGSFLDLIAPASQLR